MTYKENTPTFNVNRSVVNFNDFCKTCEEPKLKKMKRQRKSNTTDTQQHIGNFNQKFNPVTRKIDNLSPAEVDDRLEELEESVLNKFNEEFDENVNPFGHKGEDDDFSSENKKELSHFLKNQIKVAFENTVLCARTNSPQESYDYAERMANMIIKMIEEGR